MKTFKALLLAQALVVVTILTGRIVHAADTSTWRGSGKVYDLNVEELSSYELTVENSKISSQQSTTKVTVSRAEQAPLIFTCTHSHKDNKWSSVCSNGKGGGFCLNELCQTYVENEAGTAFATTMIFDGANDMRLLRTELKNGKAVRFYKEKISRSAL